MNKLLRKIIFWGGCATYFFVVAVVFCLLVEPEMQQNLPFGFDASVSSLEYSSEKSLLESVGQPDGPSGVLIPLGPGDGRLPGASSIWREFQNVGQVSSTRPFAYGFDGLQSVENINDLSAGAVSELFLSGSPRQMFRNGHLVYLLTDRQEVLVVDCENPREPTLSEALPYSSVKRMVFQDAIAYLLLESQGASTDILVVVDLATPGKPRELTRIEVPGDTFSLFFFDSQLVIYTAKRGYKDNNRVYLYDVDDHFQPRLLGSAKSPSLGVHFLQFENYLLVPEVPEGLSIYDFSDPLNPVLTASLPLERLSRLAKYGGYVFAKGRDERMYAIDLSNPLQPLVSTVVENAKYSAYLMSYDRYSYFFSFNGYLRVFDLPLGTSSARDAQRGVVDGELTSLSTGTGFTLLGKAQNLLPASVTGALVLPDTLEIVDHLIWQDSLVLLDSEGKLHFFREEDSSLTQWQELQLVTPQRWLAADKATLYVGGKNSISIIVNNDDDLVSVSRQVPLAEKESWDGLVLKKTLYLAAGNDGVLTFTLQQPDLPTSTSGWNAPRHLQSQVDVRQLVSTDDGRVLFTAGSAGLLSGRMGADGQFRQEGSLRFASPVLAVVTQGGLALVSTGENVSVVDVRDANSFQALGKVALPDVEKLVVAPPGFWAGYVAQKGWSILPLPRFVLPGDFVSLHGENRDPLHTDGHHHYRLHLFDDRDVKVMPGIQHFAAHLTKQSNGGGHVNH